MTRLLVVLVLVLVLVASTHALADDPIVKETTTGPVTARVTVSPANPVLGDAITLTLEVTAEPGVDVRMPAFGEALGRFEITDFTPRERRTEAGGTVASQRYTLEAPMSGKQTVPQLLVEFVDRRAGGSDEIRELYTDEVPIEVRSVAPDAAAANTLRPARGPLPEDWPPAEQSAAGVWAGLAGVAGAAIAAVLGLRARRARARLTAYDVAIARLREIEAKGLPDPDAADAWYVALSDIVRRYIEDRYGLRAPELTTQEFMQLASRSPELSAAHRSLLGNFLDRCDRVKFAAYRPGENESRDALGAARRFLDETRPERTAPARAPAEVAA